MTEHHTRIATPAPTVLTPAAQARAIAEDVRGTADSGLRDLDPEQKIALAEVYALLALAEAITSSTARVRP